MNVMTIDNNKRDKLPKSFQASLRELQEELKNGRPQPTERKEALPLNQIRFALGVFQPRLFDGDRANSAEHIDTLKDALKARQKFPPVTVWWSGTGWRVIDGHHRVAAYKQHCREAKTAPSATMVSVEVFEGSLNEAIAKATELNSRDKLQMTKADKLERAWKLVTLQDPALSRDAIALTAGIAPRSVGNMRAELEKLKLDPEVNPMEMTWDEVKSGKPKPDFDDQRQEQMAQQWAKRLIKTFGAKTLVRSPDILARAIEITSDALPRRMISGWWLDEARELALAEDDPEAAF